MLIDIIKSTKLNDLLLCENSADDICTDNSKLSLLEIFLGNESSRL